MLNQTMGTCEFPGSLNRGYDSKKPKGKKKKPTAAVTLPARTQSRGGLGLIHLKGLGEVINRRGEVEVMRG